MSIKIKLISLFSAFILVISLLVVGVYAIGLQSIHLSGIINFDVTDKTLYVKDVRIKNDSSLAGQGSTMENFTPGFVSGDFYIDLGTVTNTTGEFALYIDVINTSTTSFTVSTNSTLSNAKISVNGNISGDGVALGDVTNYQSISGTIVILVTFTGQGTGSVNLDNILVNVEESVPSANYYDVTLNISSSVPEELQIDVNTVSGKVTYTLSQLDTDGDGVQILENCSTISFTALHSGKPAIVITIEGGKTYDIVPESISSDWDSTTGEIAITQNTTINLSTTNWIPGITL